MKHKVGGGFRLMIAALIFLASCAPVNATLEGKRVTLPNEGIPALQVKIDRSGLDSCRLPGPQTGTIGRKTHWESSMGSQGSIWTDLYEVDEVTDMGSCDRMRSVFIKTEVAGKLPEQQTNPSSQEAPFTPIGGTPNSKK